MFESLKNTIKSKEDFMKKRSIPLSVFLTVITFGIYGIVWWFKVTDETINELNYGSIDSAPLNLFYLIITFGFGGIIRFPHT